jgi:hypothetical protein
VLRLIRGEELIPEHYSVPLPSSSLLAGKQGHGFLVAEIRFERHFQETRRYAKSRLISAAAILGFPAELTIGLKYTPVLLEIRSGSGWLGTVPGH